MLSHNRNATGISPANSFSPIIAHLLCDDSIRNCFGYLLDHQNAREQNADSSVSGNFAFFLVRSNRANGTESGIIMQIFFVGKIFQPLLLALNGLFSNANKFKDGETVLLHALPENALNRCDSVFIKPLENDDWRKIISSAEQVEELLLGQLRVVHQNMNICIHLNNGGTANFTIGEILPLIPSSICNGSGMTFSHAPVFLMTVGTRVLVDAPYSVIVAKPEEGEEKEGQYGSKKGNLSEKTTLNGPFSGTDCEMFDCSANFAHFGVISRVFCCPVADFFPLAPSSSSSNPFFAAHHRLFLLLNTLPFVFVSHGTCFKRKEYHELRKCCVCVQLDDDEESGHFVEAVLVELPQAEGQAIGGPLAHFCERLSHLIEQFRHSSGLSHCWISPSLSRLFRRSVHLRWIRIRPISPDHLKSIANLVIYSKNHAYSEEAKQTFLDLIASCREFYTPWLFPSGKCHWILRLTKAELADEQSQIKSEKQLFIKLMEAEEKTNGNGNDRKRAHRILWPLSPKTMFEFREDEGIMCRHPTDECLSEDIGGTEIVTIPPRHSYQKSAPMVKLPAQQSVLSSLSHSIRTFIIGTKLRNGEAAAVPLALLLEGPCGSGKSVLLAELVNKLRNITDGGEFVPIAAEIVDCAEVGNSLRHFADSVDFALAELVKRWPSSLFLDNFDIFVEKIGGDSQLQNEELKDRLIYQMTFDKLFGESRRRKVPIVFAVSNGSKVAEEMLAWEGQPLKAEIHRIEPIDKCTQKEMLNKLLTYEHVMRTIPPYESANFATIGELCRLVEKLELRIAANRAPAEVTPFDSEDIRSVASICKRNEFGEGERSIRFDQIAGLESVKRKLAEIFIWPARYPTLFALSTVRVGHRAILHGPSGCGKSILSRALAGEMGVNVFTVRGPQLLSKYIGQSEQNVRQLFAKAKASKPALIIFDEIDAIAPQRGSDNSHVTDRMVNQMLTELDGFEGDTDGIFVIAATNRIDLVDRALLRPGRFDFKLHIGLPDFVVRLAILRLYSTTEWGIYLSDNVNLKLIAQQTEGFSGAEMRAVVQNALYESERENKKDGKFENQMPRVCQKHFNRAIGHFGKRGEEYSTKEGTILKQRLTFNS